MADSNTTKNALAASLKDLMKDREFEKISVSEICEECGINRKSFYYHFRDKYDLVNWIFYVDFMERMTTARYDNDWEALEILCSGFYEERDFYLKAFEIEGQNSFHEYVVEVITPLVAYFVGDTLKDNSEDEFFKYFIADAIVNSMIRWLKDGMQMKPAEFVKKLKDVLVRLALRIVSETGMGEKLP